MPPKAKKKLHSSDTRYGTASSEDLRKASALLGKYAADLEGLAAAMEADEIEEVDIDGARKLDKGLELLAKYLGNVNGAFSKAKYFPGG